MCKCKDETLIVMYCGFFHTADLYFLYSIASCFLCWNNKIFPSVMGVDGIGFGGRIENLKAAVNNREHCMESPWFLRRCILSLLTLLEACSSVNHFSQ
jgi:hypothetical protein